MSIGGQQRLIYITESLELQIVITTKCFLMGERLNAIVTNCFKIEKISFQTGNEINKASEIIQHQSGVCSCRMSIPVHVLM